MAQLQAILQAMADPMIVYDKDGRILETNLPAEDLTGYRVTAPSDQQTPRANVPLIALFDADGHALRHDERPMTRMLRGLDGRARSG